MSLPVSTNWPLFVFSPNIAPSCRLKRAMVSASSELLLPTSPAAISCRFAGNCGPVVISNASNPLMRGNWPSNSLICWPKPLPGSMANHAPSMPSPWTPAYKLLPSLARAPTGSVRVKPPNWSDTLMGTGFSRSAPVSGSSSWMMGNDCWTGKQPNWLHCSKVTMSFVTT